MATGQIQQGKIAEWSGEKGFGFLKHGREKLFVHRRDCIDLHHAPRCGDRVEFIVGEDARGRSCARNVRTLSAASQLQGIHFCNLFCLLFLPTIAAINAPYDVRWIALWVVVVSLLAWQSYSLDKRNARLGFRRTPERVLHFLEFIGGWPGAYLAQKNFRHKTKKVSYQVEFWMVVSLYQFIAFDYLIQWRISKVIVGFMESMVSSVH